MPPPMGNKTILGTGVRWIVNPKTQLLFQYNPLQSEMWSAGIVGKQDKRTTLFAEMKMDMQKKTDVAFGYRINMSEGQMTGCFSSNLKATSQYKKMLLDGMASVTFVGTSDFSKPKGKTTFGLTLNIGGG